MPQPDSSPPVPRPPETAPGWSVTGRCLLEDGAERRCRASAVTPDSAEIATAGETGLGGRVICYLDDIGAVSGRVNALRPWGFRLDLELGDVRRARVAARIAWHGARAGSERREAPRIVPIHAETLVHIDDDLAIAATILDLSMVGLALRLAEPVRPCIGTVVRVGLRYATVTRPIEDGFAARFKLPFTRATFHPGVIV